MAAFHAGSSSSTKAKLSDMVYLLLRGTRAASSIADRVSANEQHHDRQLIMKAAARIFLHGASERLVDVQGMRNAAAQVVIN